MFYQTKHKPHAGHWKGQKMLFLSLMNPDLWVFDLDLRTRLSKGPNTSSLWIWCKSIQWCQDISYTNKKITDSTKNRTLRSSLCAVKSKYHSQHLDMEYHKTSDRCLPYFYTWCGLSANLRCRSEACCTRLAETQDAKKSPKIAIWSPSPNFVGLYLRN